MRGESANRHPGSVNEPIGFVVRGECMRGLAEGEHVQVRSRLVYFPGDVVVVRRANHFSVHRFLGYAWTPHGMRVLTQADHDPRPDPASRSAAVVGAVDSSVAVSERVRSLVLYTRAVSRRVLRGRT